MKKLKVSTFFLEDKNHACPTIRILSPLKKLEEQGKISLSAGITVRGSDVDVSLEKIADSDIVIIQRQAARKELADHIFRLAGQLKKKVIIEMDDLLINTPPSNIHARCLEEMRDGIIKSLKKSDAVTCTTPALRRHLTDYARKVFILPNYIDMDIWRNGKEIEKKQKDKTVIAFTGTPTHVDDLKMITPAIKEILTRHGEKVEFRFWGCITDELKSMDGVIFVKELIPDYREYARTLRDSGIDIAVSPLEDNVFNECKSNIKFLEYSICKIPGIYSNITPYANSIINGETGIICDDDTDSWYKAMVKLIEERDVRNQIAENAYKEVLEKYTLEANAYKWYDLYKTLVDKTTYNFSLVETKKGSFTLRVKGNDGSTKTLHSLYDPVAEARAIVNAFQFDGRGILVVIGLGLGYHLSELVKRFPDAEILVVEAVPEIYELAKEDSPEFGDKVKFIIGLPANEVIKEITKHQLKNGISPLTVFTLSSAVSTFPDYYHPILTSLKRTVSLKIWDRLKYSKFKEESLKVILIDPGYFLVKEVESALKSLGHKVIKITVDTPPVSPLGKGGIKGGSTQTGEDNNNEGIVSRFIENILDFKPDFILTMNHLGLDEDGMMMDFFESIEMPVASWYVDSPNLIVRAFDKNVSPYTSIFMWDRSYINDMESMGFESVKYLPLGSDANVFKTITVRKHRKKLQKYACDIGFIGNSMVRPVEEYMAKVSSVYHLLIERIADELAESGGSYDQVDKIMNKDELMSIRKLSKKEMMDFEAAVIWKATLMYRLSCLQMLEGLKVNIHGDNEWTLLLNNKNCTLHPPLHYYKELPLFYNACNINFNATSRQMKEAVNQRVFDVPACGAFLLTDYQESIEELFDVGKELIVYKNKKEIPEIAGFYLKHPDKRQSIALKGRERVLNEHTYKHRLTSMIEYMKQRYK